MALRLNYPLKPLADIWEERIPLVACAYRVLAFSIATIQLLVFPSVHYSVIPPLVLIGIAGYHTLLQSIHYLRWQERCVSNFNVLGTDIVVCIFLVMSTDGIYSPFLLYTLAPVVTAALLLDRRITFSIAGLSAAYIFGIYFVNPFFLTHLSLRELSYFLIYTMAVWLIATLPYLINVNLKRRLEFENRLQERQRLSREIHDGSAQTLSSLCWQVQLLHRHLALMNVDLTEVRALGRLVEKGRQEARESLELLRNYTGDGSFLPHLKDYLAHLRQDGNIEVYLDAETDELRLEATVELELLRICQEALTNIRKHSGAHRIKVKLKSVDKHFEVSIADNGCGFDALAYYHDGLKANGHGLAVMQERAESIGGRFRVLSMPGRGTEVQIEVPAGPR